MNADISGRRLWTPGLRRVGVVAGFGLNESAYKFTSGATLRLSVRADDGQLLSLAIDSADAARCRIGDELDVTAGRYTCRKTGMDAG